MDICGLTYEQGHGFVSNNTDATIALGRALGKLLTQEDVLVLTGDLGAGKTQLTKGIAQGLGITSDITSPTFTIQMVHQGENFPLYHFDLYRLDDPDQLGDCGLWDVMGYDGVCIIEWGEQFLDDIGQDRLDVILDRMDFDVEPGVEPPRSIRFVSHNKRGEEILNKLADELELYIKG